jgi:hypothetical protein
MLLTADMTLARTRSGVQREVYLPTRPGEGQYRLERGEYLPDIHGDYRRVIATDDLQSITGYDGRQRLTASWRPEFAGWRWTIESRTERIARHDPTQFRPLPWLAPWRRSSWAAAAGSRAERYGYHRIGVRPDNTTELTLDYDLTHATESTNDVHDRRDRVGASARRSLDHDWYIEGQTDWEFRERQGVLNAPIDALARTWRLILGGTPHTGLTSSIEGRHRTDHDKISGGQTRLLGVRPRLQASLGALGVTIDNDCTWVTSESAPTSFSALLAEGRPSGFSVQETVEARWQLPGRVTLRSRLYADLRETGADRWRWELETIARF